MLPSFNFSFQFLSSASFSLCLPRGPERQNASQNQRFGGDVFTILSALWTGRPKPVNFPSWRTITIDIEHILSGHTAGGERVLAGKIADLFPRGMSDAEIER